MRVIRGQVFDVAVDLHEDSMTYCRWGIELSKENDMQFYIMEEFVYGFLVFMMWQNSVISA